MRIVISDIIKRKKKGKFMIRQPFQLNFIFFPKKIKIKMGTKNSRTSLEDCFKKQKAMKIYKLTPNFTTCLSVIL